MYANQLVISKGAGIACEICGEVSKVHKPLYSNQFPMIVKCPKCEYEDEWEYPPSTQKSLASDAIGDCWVIKNLPVAKVALTELTPMARDIEEKASAFSGELAVLEHAIDNAIAMMKEELSNRLCQSLDFLRGFDRKKYEAWLRQPILIIPVVTDNPIVDNFVKLVLSPSWQSLKLGVPMVETFGYRIDAVCSAFLPCFPLPPGIKKAVDLPSALDLRVSGDKIFGGDLHAVEELAGNDADATVGYDIDHTDGNPSYSIGNRVAFFTKFGRRGVHAKQCVPMKFAVPNERFIDAGMNNEQLTWMGEFMAASRAFCCGGSFGLFASMTAMISSVTGIPILLITDRGPEIPTGSSVVTATRAKLEKFSQSVYRDFRIIAIDYETWDMANAEELLGSQAAMLGYAKNPLLDIFARNVKHPLAVSLTPRLAMPNNYEPDPLAAKTAFVLSQLTMGI